MALANFFHFLNYKKLHISKNVVGGRAPSSLNGTTPLPIGRLNFLIKETMFSQQCATVHRTTTIERSTGRIFLLINLTCCLYVTRLRRTKKISAFGGIYKI